MLNLNLKAPLRDVYTLSGLEILEVQNLVTKQVYFAWETHKFPEFLLQSGQFILITLGASSLPGYSPVTSSTKGK
jgi:hypothetical protein